MAQAKKMARPAFDPLLGRLVAEYETSSDRVRAKLGNAYRWCFCELCGRTTEYAAAVEARTVFKRLRRGNAKAVPLTDAVRSEALKEADALVRRYEQALAGQYGPEEPGQMVVAYCDIRDMRGDTSVLAFRDQVERRMLIAAWARSGDLWSVARLPNQPEGAAKPSKLYCEHHNPRRSVEARRAYQRDRRFVAEFEELIGLIWSQQAHKLPTWDIEAHARVRREAYRHLQAMKAPTSLIGDLQAGGAVTQSDIARQLGISRQAVSAAIKRQKNWRQSHRSADYAFSLSSLATRSSARRCV